MHKHRRIHEFCQEMRGVHTAPYRACVADISRQLELQAFAQKLGVELFTRLKWVTVRSPVTALSCPQARQLRQCAGALHPLQRSPPLSACTRSS